MKESDYIVATSLAKLRLAEQLVRDLLTEPHLPINAKDRQKVLALLDLWRGRLEAAVDKSVSSEPS